MKKALLFVVLSLMLIFTLSVAFADEEVADQITEPIKLFTPAEGVELDTELNVQDPKDAVNIQLGDPVNQDEITGIPTNDGEIPVVPDGVDTTTPTDIEEVPAVPDGVDTTTPTNEVVSVEPISNTSSNKPLGAILAIVIIVIIIAVVALLQK